MSRDRDREYDRDRRDRRERDRDRDFDRGRDRAHRSRSRSRSRSPAFGGRRTGRRGGDRENEREKEPERPVWGRGDEAGPAHRAGGGDRGAPAGQGEGAAEWGKPIVKEKPNYGLSGLLTAGLNVRNGIDIKYLEPADGCVPKRHWRLYVIKDGKMLDEPLRLYSKSCYLFGRERLVADIPTDHPSCSKQHAVIQFRNVLYKDEESNMFETKIRRVERPYLMDLTSANGTFLNGEKVEPQRFIELRAKDVIRFGTSSREYVMIPTDAAETGASGDEDGAGSDADMTV